MVLIQFILERLTVPMNCRVEEHLGEISIRDFTPNFLWWQFPVFYNRLILTKYVKRNMLEATTETFYKN